MITPRFTLSQTEKTVSISIRAPYCSLGDLDISVDDNIFLFVCKPYYLRLHLPGQILDNDAMYSKFESDSGEFTFTYEKSIAGEHFPDLNFITKFLSPKIEVNEGNRTIEVLSSKEEESSDRVTFESDEFNQYGFAMRGGYNFNSVSSEFCSVFDINPFEVKLCDRKTIRLSEEGKSFCVDHYLCDLIEDDEIQEIIQTKTPWALLNASEVKFTDKELDFLKDLPNVAYNLTKIQENYCRTSLIDILFAFCYDKRTTLFDSTCESSWAINKISASLCCFDSFNSSKEAILSSFRRSLIYPLYRNFDLSIQLFKDFKLLLQLGETFIIKCLIDIYYIFLESDSSRYILNNLFIKDYITYVMKWDSDKWKEVVDHVLEIKVDKAGLNLNLLSIEKSIDDNSDNSGLLKQMNKLSIIRETEVLDSDDETDSESDSDSNSSDSGSNSSDIEDSEKVNTNAETVNI